jgi:hypothetical protein
MVDFPAVSTFDLVRSGRDFIALDVASGAALLEGFWADEVNPSPCHGGENYTAVCLEHGPLASARMDQGRRCR